MEYCVFNPDTEMALASGQKHYTPPVPVRRFGEHLCLLPALYASEGSIILLTGDVDVRALPYCKIMAYRGLTTASMRDLQDLPVSPWGWNPALKTKLRNAGVSDRALPSDERLCIWRNLAHRSTTIKILDCFDEIKDSDLMPEYVCDRRSIGLTVSGYGRTTGIVVKLPWSSSGRGVFFNPDERTVLNAMSRQGGVMVEPYWDKAFDFASEWTCVDGHARFKGFSVFQNESGGKYKGNIVAPKEYLRELICRHCDERNLESAVVRLGTALETVVAPHYDGPLGIDMLCDRHGRINPCVEMNLRMTMGHVALRLHELFGLPGGSPYYFYPGRELPFD